MCSVQNKNTVSRTLGERRRYQSNARQGRGFARLSHTEVYKGCSYICRPCVLLQKVRQRLCNNSRTTDWFDKQAKSVRLVTGSPVAFEGLKDALMEVTSLAYPIPNEPCILDTDASEVAVGAVFSQKLDGVERPIAFFPE